MAKSIFLKKFYFLKYFYLFVFLFVYKNCLYSHENNNIIIKEITDLTQTSTKESQDIQTRVYSGWFAAPELNVENEIKELANSLEKRQSKNLSSLNKKLKENFLLLITTSEGGFTFIVVPDSGRIKDLTKEISSEDFSTFPQCSQIVFASRENYNLLCAKLENLKKNCVVTWHDASTKKIDAEKKEYITKIIKKKSLYPFIRINNSDAVFNNWIEIINILNKLALNNIIVFVLEDGLGHDIIISTQDTWDQMWTSDYIETKNYLYPLFDYVQQKHENGLSNNFLTEFEMVSYKRVIFIRYKSVDQNIFFNQTAILNFLDQAVKEKSNNNISSNLDSDNNIGCNNSCNPSNFCIIN